MGDLVTGLLATLLAWAAQKTPHQVKVMFAYLFMFFCLLATLLAWAAQKTPQVRINFCLFFVRFLFICMLCSNPFGLGS